MIILNPIMFATLLLMPAQPMDSMQTAERGARYFETSESPQLSGPSASIDLASSSLRSRLWSAEQDSFQINERCLVQAYQEIIVLAMANPATQEFARYVDEAMKNSSYKRSENGNIVAATVPPIEDGKTMARIRNYLGLNVSLESSAMMTQIHVIIESLLNNKFGLMSRPNAGPYGWGFSAPFKNKKGVDIGFYELGSVRNSFLATSLVRFDKIISGSYWFSGMETAKPVKLSALEDERGTASIRQDGYPEGKIVFLKCRGEDDVLMSSEIIDVAAKEFGIMKGYVASPNGKALTEVYTIPGGGYRLLGGKKKIVVYGAFFSKATPLGFDIYYNEKGGEPSLKPSAAFTYLGSDERYYASVFASDGSIVMHGVWLNDDARIAGKVTAPTDFRTIAIK